VASRPAELHLAWKRDSDVPLLAQLRTLLRDLA
jgi:hypothetical protein